MKRIFILFLLLSAYYGQAQILNIENYRIKTDTTGWSGKLGVDFSMTKNTKSLIRFGSNLHVQYKTNRSLYLLLGQYHIFVSDGSNLIDKSVAHFRYNYKFTDRVVGETFVQVQRNTISKIDLRSLYGAGMRFKLSPNKAHRYYLGSALMFEQEQSIENAESLQNILRWSNYFSTSLYPTKIFTFISTTYYQPALQSFSDYRILSQNSMAFLISTHLSFKTSFNIQYDSNPVSGIPNMQYGLTSGLVYLL